ncbi:MAG: hypothetical protein ACRERD_32400 [Candidatus Binatia bacterium]
MKSTAQQGHAQASALPGEALPLPPQYAFVVQLRMGAERLTGPLTGRVEHITSGDATRFTSVEELVAFMRRRVAEQQQKAGEKE